MAEFEKAAVKPFYEDAPLDIDFQKRLKSVVVTNLDMLDKICNQENKVVAFDTETTGLVYYKDHIVGCSMSFNGESGFYVPLRHEQPDGTPATFNLPIKESLHLIYEKLLKRNQVILYNSCFDLTMIGQELDKIGVDFTDIENVKFLDAQCLVYFLEPEIKKNGLKWAARHFLGRISPEFLQVLGVTKKSIKTKGKHFGHINPWQEVTIEPQFIELKGAKKKLTEADVLHNNDMLQIGAYTTTGAVYAVCHDDKTEVLTSSGWVHWSEYDGITPLATVNLNTELIEYQEPTGLTKYYYEGNMVYYKAKALDFCVTPNHRMLVYKAQNKAKGVIKKEIKDFNMYEKLYYQPKGKASSNNFELLTSQGVLLSTNQVAKLTALILADGWVRSRSEKSRGYQIGVALSKHKNYEEIKAFLESLGLKSNFYKKNDIIESWIVNDKNIWDLLHPCCKGGAREKYIPDFIKAMSSSDLSDFIHFYNMTDGSTHNGVHQLFTTSTRMKDDLQEVLLLTGRHSCIYTRKPKDAYIRDRLIAKENCADLYFLYFSDKKQSVGVTRNTSRGNWKNTAYNGYVYCAEVPNHTLITRRNGKILISGNCDSSNTYALYEKLCPVVQDMQMQHNKTTLDPFAFVTDSRLAKAMLHYKHTPISIDSKLMGNFLEDVENQIEETETKIFEMAGKPFNISSTPQKREIFQSLGINTGVETKTGMSVSVSALANVNHPIVDLLTKRSHLEKRRSAYFEPLSKEQISRINYKTCAVATGRLASGKGNEVENTYFSSISVQTLPKSKMCLYEAVYVGENNSDPENILGYKFHPVTPTYAEGNPDKIYVEGFSQELNVRNSLCAPHHIYVDTENEKLDFGFDIIKAENYIRQNNLEPERLICEKSNDWYVCSLDISAEELAIIANLSKEPNFIEPLLQRADLHRCYSDDTEFLTENGFKKFDDITPDEKIAQYHPDGTIDYVLPSDRHESYSDEMITVKNNYIDLRVTPNHRMLYRTSKINPYRVKEMEELVGKNFLLQTTGKDFTGSDRTESFEFSSTEIQGREYNKNVTFEPDTFIEFLGFFLGDGYVGINHLNKGNSYRIHVSQSLKQCKHADYLLDLNKRMGDFFAVYRNKKQSEIRLERNHISMCKWLLENLFDENGNRRVPSWIYKLSHRQRELFLNAFIKAQGHISRRPNRTFKMLHAETEPLFHDLFRLCFLQGYHVHQYPYRGKGYSFGICDREFDGVKKEHIEKIPEKCRVVCFSVPSSFLVVKRNNKICVSGNSMAQKMFPEFATADKATQKNLRKKAKSGNFGLAYRGSHLALRDIDSEEEQLRVYNAWWSNMPIYRQWQQEKINEMMMFTEGDAINHYGRKRRFKHLLTTGRQSDTNSAIRAACNHYVQGLGADYIRICMSRFYDEILKENKNFNEIRFVASIHDELAFAIRKDVLDKWLFKVMTIMETSYPEEFIVPFISNAQIGPTFGFGFDFDYERDPKTFKLIEGSKLGLRV